MCTDSEEIEIISSMRQAQVSVSDKNNGLVIALRNEGLKKIKLCNREVLRAPKLWIDIFKPHGFITVNLINKLFVYCRIQRIVSNRVIFFRNTARPVRIASCKVL